MAVSTASEPLKIENERDRISYSLGYQIGGDFKRQALDMNAAAVVRGIEDALSSAVPLLDEKAMRATLVELKRKVLEQQQAQQAARTEAKRTAGRAFLKENAAKEGVVTLPSGLQYRVLVPGTGAHPGPQDNVTLSYRGTLVNGQEFDNSNRRKEPATFNVSGVMRGWTEALQLMSVGAKWNLYLPPELAYGESGPLADEALIFEIELLAINAPK
ncbi:MAG: FKBP-type peptidyl-prolyl cis-trans isomerase [Gammaproteobacteria bacterium]|nr:FKBP-type peptidyl-prolyl cis-trans isomerase [Gammaproteobacteria bacterium]